MHKATCTLGISIPQIQADNLKIPPDFETHLMPVLDFHQSLNFANQVVW